MGCVARATAAATVRPAELLAGSRREDLLLHLNVLNLSVCPPDVCVADVDSFVSQRIPDSDGQISPLSKKRGWKKRRMDVKEPSGECFHHLSRPSCSACVFVLS